MKLWYAVWGEEGPWLAFAPRSWRWQRAIRRGRKALFVSSLVGLEHVQRDLAIAREIRQLQPSLQIDWFTVDPASAIQRTSPIARSVRSFRASVSGLTAIVHTVVTHFRSTLSPSRIPIATQEVGVRTR
ncbi:MAG: hypothetical protein ABIT38_02035 [Gemmatimonadaceae bacterium]